MLAEIYLLKLEAAVRAAKEAATTLDLAVCAGHLTGCQGVLTPPSIAPSPSARRSEAHPSDSEQFRPAPKVPHASMRKHLRCQRATSRAFGDKRLFREVSKTGALEIPVALPLEARVRVAASAAWEFR